MPVVSAVVVVPRPQRHHDLFQRAVAGPLADAVDRALDLPGAVLDGGQAVGDGQAQVVVAVDADDRLVDVRHALVEVRDDAGVLRGRGVADGVGDVDRRRAGVDGRLDDLGRGSRARCGRRPRARTRCRRSSRLARFTPATARLDDLLLGHLQLELAVDGAGGQEDVDARLCGVLEGLPGAVDVAVVAAGQAADGRAGDLGGDRADRLEVAGRGDREAGLDDVDAQVDQGLGDLQLLGEVHAARRAIARRRAAWCRRSGSDWSSAMSGLFRSERVGSGQDDRIDRSGGNGRSPEIHRSRAGLGAS